MKSYFKDPPIRLKGKAWTNLKQECFTRDNFTCRACGKMHVEDDHMLDAHHIKNRSQGGEDTLENLVSACRLPCHHLITIKKLPNDFEN